MEQQLGVLLNAKLDEFEQGLSSEASAEVQCDHSRFRSEADAIMQQLLALNKYIAEHEQYAHTLCRSTYLGLLIVSIAFKLPHMEAAHGHVAPLHQLLASVCLQPALMGAACTVLDMLCEDVSKQPCCSTIAGPQRRQKQELGFVCQCCLP